MVKCPFCPCLLLLLPHSRFFSLARSAGRHRAGRVACGREPCSAQDEHAGWLRPWRGDGAGTPPGKLGSGHGAGELGPEEGGHGHSKGGLQLWRERGDYIGDDGWGREEHRHWRCAGHLPPHKPRRRRGTSWQLVAPRSYTRAGAREQPLVRPLCSALLSPPCVAPPWPVADSRSQGQRGDGAWGQAEGRLRKIRGEARGCGG